MTEAAKDLGVTVGSVSRAYQKNRLESLGLGIDCNRLPVLIRGTEYESIAEAAKNLGVHPSTISKALNDGRVDRVGLKRKKNDKKNSGRN